MSESESLNALKQSHELLYLSTSATTTCALNSAL